MKENKEFNFDKELEKWFYKWHRKPVTGRCLIELKQRDKEFIRLLKEEWATYGGFIDSINKLAGSKLVGEGK